MAGNGQDELVEALTGLRTPHAAGASLLDGGDVTGVWARATCRARACPSCPATATASGWCCRFPLTDNLVLTQYDEAPYARGICRNEAAMRRVGRARPSRSTTSGRRRRHVAAPARCPAATSRRRSWRASSVATCSVLVLDQPTRGLDVGSIEFIHRQVIAKRDAGAAVLLVSAELDEVMELSDRIGVMYRASSSR